MNKPICPVCGSTEVIETQKKEIISVPFGGNKVINIIENKCKACESTGDFYNKNELELKKNIDELKTNSIISILEYFTNNHISLASIERALGIPQRTLTKWKNKTTNPTSTGVALFRFLRIFPWLLEVAEKNFDYRNAQQLYLKTAFNNLIDSLIYDEDNFVYSTSMAATSRHFFLHIEKQGLNDLEQKQIRSVNNDNMQIIEDNVSINFFEGVI